MPDNFKDLRNKIVQTINYITIKSCEVKNGFYFPEYSYGVKGNTRCACEISKLMQ